MIPGGFTAVSEYTVEYLFANGVRQRTITTTADEWNGSPVRGKTGPNDLHHGVKFQGAIQFKHREKNTLPGASAEKLQPSVGFQNPRGNHEPLNLAGPFVNLRDACVAIRSLDGILAAVAVAPMNLNRFMRHARGHFAGE